MISVREEILSLNARNRIDNLPKGTKSQFFRDAIEFYVEYLTSNVVMTKEVYKELESLKKEVTEIRLAIGKEAVQIREKEQCFEELVKEEVKEGIVATQEQPNVVTQEDTIDNEEERLKDLVIESILSFVNRGEGKEQSNDECCG